MTTDFLLLPPFAADLAEHEDSIANGAKFGRGGGHLSRTLMLSELTMLMTGAALSSEELRERVVVENCLGKPTLATRKSSFQRLRELFGLDPKLPLFSGLQFFWERDVPARPLLAMVLALARDPIFRTSVAPILTSMHGAQVTKTDFLKSVEMGTAGRYSEAIVDKIARHTAASWGQTGHLKGRVFKIRNQVSPTPAALAYAAFAGYCCGLRGEALFMSVFARLLDRSYDHLLMLAGDANRLGLMSFRQAGGIIEVSFPQLASSPK